MTNDQPAASGPPTPDPTQVRLVKEFKHSRPLFACRIDRTGRFAFTGAQDNLVVRWDLEGDAKLELAGHESWVRGIALQPSGELLASGDYAGKFCVWRLATEGIAPPAWQVAAHQGWLRAVAASPDGTTFATCGNDRLVRLFSAADGKLVRELPGHDCHVYNAAFHPSGSQLASCDLKGVVKHWDLSSGAPVRQLDASLLWKYDPTFHADIGGARGMTFSPGGAWLACAGVTEVTNAFAGIGNAVVVLFDWATGERKQVLRPKEHFQGVAWSVAFHPAGFIVAVAGGQHGGTLWFYRPQQPEPFFTFKLPAGARDLALHPDGNRLVVAHTDSVLRLYDMTPKPPT
ncbi:MAG TPA: WD40 repeat domain-containing protein [Pirellulales bacterium]|nr:WD40 repeat domain-containing protein [Pirellulales bacterium]